MNFEVKTENYNDIIPEEQYYLNFIPTVDGERVADIILKHIDEEILINPYTDEDIGMEAIFDGGRIGVEMPKDYFEDDCEYKEEYIAEYTKMFERAYVLSTREDMPKKDIDTVLFIEVNIERETNTSNQFKFIYSSEVPYIDKWDKVSLDVAKELTKRFIINNFKNILLNVIFQKSRLVTTEWNNELFLGYMKGIFDD